MSGTETHRQRQLVGLRLLFNFLETHPDVPIGSDEVNSVCIVAGDDETGMDQLRAIADALGVEITHNASGTHHYAIRLFGAVPYRAVYVSAASMAEYVEEQRWVRERRAAVTS